MKNILYIQISNSIINIEPDKFYDNYHKALGLKKPTHFWEIPLWIPEIDFFLNKENNTSLHIYTDNKNLFKKINKFKPDFILFSILDVNKKIINQIVESINEKKYNIEFIGGGYINKKEVHKKIHWFNSTNELADFFNIKYEHGTNYNLFKRYKTVPRLEISKGCIFNCSYCTIDKNIIIIDNKSIIQQAKSFKKLNFEYVYIDDKSFGQTKNIEILPKIYRTIKQYNKKFKGFIIQTVASLFVQKNIDINKYHIKYLEFGLESFNDFILKKHNKPSKEKDIINLIDILKKTKVNIIPNIIIGFPEENKESYEKTYNFLKDNIKHFKYLNIYNLSLYKDTKLSNELNFEVIDNDDNELSSYRSYYSEEFNKLSEYYFNKIKKLFLDYKIYKK